MEAKLETLAKHPEFDADFLESARQSDAQRAEIQIEPRQNGNGRPESRPFNLGF